MNALRSTGSTDRATYTVGYDFMRVADPRESFRLMSILPSRSGVKAQPWANGVTYQIACLPWTTMGNIVTSWLRSAASARPRFGAWALLLLSPHIPPPPWPDHHRSWFGHHEGLEIQYVGDNILQHALVCSTYVCVCVEGILLFHSPFFAFFCLHFYFVCPAFFLFFSFFVFLFSRVSVSEWLSSIYFEYVYTLLPWLNLEQFI